MKTFTILSVLIVTSAAASCSRGPVADVMLTFKDGSDTTLTVGMKHFASGVDKGRDCYRLQFEDGDLDNVAKVEIIPSFGKAIEGDEGYFLNAEGLLTKFLPRENKCSYRTEYNDLGLAGYKHAQDCWVAILKSLDLECREVISY